MVSISKGHRSISICLTRFVTTVASLGSMIHRVCLYTSSVYLFHTKFWKFAARPSYSWKWLEWFHNHQLLKFMWRRENRPFVNGRKVFIHLLRDQHLGFNEIFMGTKLVCGIGSRMIFGDGFVLPTGDNGYESNISRYNLDHLNGVIMQADRSDITPS